MHNHETNADPAPAFTTDAEIAIADRLRQQLEARYLVPATNRQATQRTLLRETPAATGDRQQDDAVGEVAENDATKSGARPPDRSFTFPKAGNWSSIPGRPSSSS